MKRLWVVLFIISGFILPNISSAQVCDIQMSQTSYTSGDTVTAQVFRFANPGPNNLPIELKVWLGWPGGPPISILNIGAYGSFILSPGFDQDYGPLSLFPVTVGTSPGSYELSCRMRDPVTGELLAEDLNPFNITAPPVITITSPSDGSTIDAAAISVSGTIDTSVNYVMVNGMPAIITGTNYTAHDVSLSIGTNTITADAYDSNFNPIGSASITVTTQDTTTYYTQISADTTSGTAPLNVTLSAAGNWPIGSPVDTTTYQWDLDGDGIIDQTTTAPNNSIQTTYSQARIYHPRVIVTDLNNTKYSDTLDINVHLPTQTINTFAIGDPVDIAKDSSNNLYVLDSTASTVSIYDQDGNLLSSFGTLGTGDGQLTNPMGIALDQTDNIWVADTGNNRIQRFDGTGVFIEKWDVNTTGYAFDQPRGIAIDSAGNVYITELQAGNVVKFDSTGSSIFTWTALNDPRSVYVDTSDNLYIVESGSNWVKKYTQSGSSILTISNLNNPSDLTTGNGYLYISDTGSSRLARYDESTVQFTQYVTADLTNPTAIAPGSRLTKETVYVIDNGVVKEIEVPVESPVGVWDAMRQALINGDIEGALVYLNEGSKDKYRDLFNALISGLPTLAANMQPIQLIYIKDDTAKYRIRRDQIIDGQQETITYYIYLKKDRDGLWKIVSF